MPHHVEVIEGVEHPVQGGLYVELLDLGFIECLSWLGDFDQECTGPSLVGYCQATVAIKGHDYPRTILLLVHLVNKVDDEARLHVEASRRILDRFFQRRQLVLPKCAGQRE